jgi:hypothetical protein
MLEDRTVLSNAAYTGELSQLSATIAANINQLNNMAQQINNDVAAFERNPHDINALVNLAVDDTKLQSASAVLQDQVTLFDSAVKAGEAFGLVTGSVDTFLFENQAAGFLAQSTHFQNLGADATGDFIAAFVAFVGGANAQLQALPGTPTPSPSPSPTPTGTVGESINQAPATWPSDAKIGPWESVTVANPTNAPLTVTVSYQASDGSKSSNSDVCTSPTITVTTGAPVSAPGVTGTWTVSVTGQPDQTNTTTFQ